MFFCMYTSESLHHRSNRTWNATEKGILKKHGYGLVHGEQLKDKWCDDSQSDNLELITQDGTQASTIGGAAASEVERTLKSLNGYHEDILEALRNAASHRGTGTGNTPVGSGSLSEEMLRKTLQDCSSAQLGYSAEPHKRASGSKSSSRENVCDSATAHAILLDGGVGGGSGLGGLSFGADISSVRGVAGMGGGGGGGSIGVGGGSTSGMGTAMGHGGSAMMHHHRSQHQLHQPSGLSMQQQQPTDEDDAPSTGPLRIRNLEDLIRQLEHHSSRHMSPSGSEDIRMSETEADRHYRLDSSAACSESSQGLVSPMCSRLCCDSTMYIRYNPYSYDPTIPSLPYPAVSRSDNLIDQSVNTDKSLLRLGSYVYFASPDISRRNTRTLTHTHKHNHRQTHSELYLV